MRSQQPWLDHYPAGVPAEIDMTEFTSITDVFDKAIAQYGNKTAFINMGKSLTYAELDRLSRDFAGYLLGELKLKKGDRVAIMMPNCLQYPVAIFGVLRAGLTVVNTNPMYTPRELKHLSLIHIEMCIRDSFYTVGYGCTTCIGNSGPLPVDVSAGIAAGDLCVASVLSGNRNFEGRIHAEVKMNYLASPPLVVALSLIHI